MTTSADPDWSVITEEQFDDLLRLARLYLREARRAENAKAYLASCVMYGSALEAELIGMVHLYPEDIPSTAPLPMRGKHIKNVLEWNLDQLIRVASVAGWLPAGLDVPESWNHRKAKIGDYSRWLKAVRNLVHPARYVRDHPKKRITAKYAKQADEVFSIASGHVYARFARFIEEREAAGELDA
jgi:hypothetical protein